MTKIKTQYGYTITMDGEHDIEVENDQGRLVAFFTPADIYELNKKAAEIIEKNYEENRT